MFCIVLHCDKISVQIEVAISKRCVLLKPMHVFLSYFNGKSVYSFYYFWKPIILYFCLILFIFDHIYIYLLKCIYLILQIFNIIVLYVC